jgi:hypothetical protein
MHLRRKCIHGKHHEEIYGSGYDDERNERIDKISVQKLAPVDGEGQLGKIRLFCDGRDERRKQIFHERRDDRIECRPDHYTDRQIHHIPPQYEIPESLEHIPIVAVYSIIMKVR